MRSSYFNLLSGAGGAIAGIFLTGGLSFVPSIALTVASTIGTMGLSRVIRNRIGGHKESSDFLSGRNETLSQTDGKKFMLSAAGGAVGMFGGLRVLEATGRGDLALLAAASGVCLPFLVNIAANGTIGVAKDMANDMGWGGKSQELVSQNPDTYTHPASSLELYADKAKADKQLAPCIP
ncbi:MAG: hypothetical protein LRY76_04480 [Alphaproteobacteria bacterium]|nr:hypothetical protein [Alphaproteobacteria bacterium]MCD8570775.1 hypothetical protein [Alphaproteobacteria bacterium]